MSNLFRKTIILIALVETVSFLGHFFPWLGGIAFFAAILAVLVLSLKRLEYGVYTALAELVIGSKGYLLSFEAGGVELSLRIGIFIAVMSAWLFHAIKTRRVKLFQSSKKSCQISESRLSEALPSWMAF